MTEALKDDQEVTVAIESNKDVKSFIYHFNFMIGFGVREVPLQNGQTNIVSSRRDLTREDLSKILRKAGFKLIEV